MNALIILAILAVLIFLCIVLFSKSPSGDTVAGVFIDLICDIFDD